jgi:single-strand DNA-binding protein
MICSGYVKRDPHTAFSRKGAQVTSFTIKSTRTHKNSTGERVHEVEFHRCVSFGKMAESISQFIKDDDYIRVQGRMKSRNYQHKDHDIKMTIWEIVIEGWEFEGRAEKKKEPENQPPEPPPITGEDVPYQEEG